MPPRRTPKRLRDVSHLFLSKSGSFKFTEERSVEAVVWLAVTGRSLNRAYLASGIGTAFARLGMKVTLLELGEGLPNIGYYFTREPAEYLGATLDGRAVIYGVSESLISYAYAVQPEAFGHIQDTVSFPGYPHLIVVAFLCSDGACNGEWFKRLNGCSSRFSGQGAKVQKPPDGVVLFTRGDPVDDYRGFIDEFRSLSSDAVLFLASPSFGVEPGGGVDERILIPADLVSSWYRPIPPSQPFFTDLCSSFLQVLSFRRRRKAKYAAG